MAIEIQAKNPVIRLGVPGPAGGGGSSIALDTTLTQPGKAADAKAVGDALAEKQPKGDYLTQNELPDMTAYRTAEAQDVIDAGKQTALIQSGASVGQIAKITAVDESGKPTAWEAVDMPSGSGDTLLYHYDTSEDAIITSTALVPNLDISTASMLLFKWHINGYGTEFGGRLMINNQPITIYFPYLHRKAGDTVDIFCVVAVSDVSLTLIKFIVDSNYRTDSADFLYVNGGTNGNSNVINIPNSGTIESFGIQGATVVSTVPVDKGEVLDYTTSGFSVDVYKVG